MISESRVTRKRVEPVRYSDTKAPSSIPRVWRHAARAACIALALLTAWFVGNSFFDYFKQVYPIKEIGWEDYRATKPIRPSAREFAQTIQIERQYLEETLHAVLPQNVRAHGIWHTCGETDCVRPSIEKLMLFTHQIPDAPSQAAYVQRVCNLSAKYFQANIARIQWAYDQNSRRCMAVNWQAIEAEVNVINRNAKLGGLAAAIAVGLGGLAIGFWLVSQIERRIDENDREISIEN